MNVSKKILSLALVLIMLISFGPVKISADSKIGIDDVKRLVNLEKIDTYYLETYGDNSSAYECYRVKDDITDGLRITLATPDKFIFIKDGYLVTDLRINEKLSSIAVAANYEKWLESTLGMVNTLNEIKNSAVLDKTIGIVGGLGSTALGVIANVYLTGGTLKEVTEFNKIALESTQAVLEGYVFDYDNMVTEIQWCMFVQGISEINIGLLDMQRSIPEQGIKTYSEAAVFLGKSLEVEKSVYAVTRILNGALENIPADAKEYLVNCFKSLTDGFIGSYVEALEASDDVGKLMSQTGDFYYFAKIVIGLYFIKDSLELMQSYMEGIKSEEIGLIPDLYQYMDARKFVEKVNANTVAQNMNRAVTVVIASKLGVDIPIDEGAGSLDDPYIIRTASQLNEIRNGLDKYYELGADIDLSEFNNGYWIPIGIPKEQPFKGTLRGNGYSINNLRVNGGVLGNMYYSSGYVVKYINAGLFSAIDGAEISDLNINISPSGSISALYENAPGTYAGGIAGLAENSQISNCRVYGAVSSANNKGGIVGGSSNSKITNCYFRGTTQDIGSSSGGITGYSSADEIKGCTVEDAVINAVTGSYNQQGHAGGITGSINESKVIDCQVINSTVSATFSGGLIGATVATWGNNIISGCFSSGLVKGSGRVGGLIGKVDRYTQISNSCSLADVSVYNAHSTPGDGIIFNATAGGFVGIVWNEGSISIQNCYSAGKVSTSDDFVPSEIRIGSFGGHGGFGWGYSSDWKIGNCFVDSNVNETLEPYGDCGRNVTFPLKKSTADMKNKATYSGWDFDTVWRIDGITNKGYPFLRSMKPIAYFNRCDINKDGFINIFDVVFVARNYGLTDSDAEWVPTYDLKIDGVIDLFDLIVMSKQF